MCPRVKKTVPTVAPSKLPWFWVGVKSLDKTVCVTDVINSHIRYGTLVTKELLSEVTQIDNKNVVWKYIDAKTLEEKEFPSQGIVIEDDVC